MTKAKRGVRALTFEYYGIAARELQSAKEVAGRVGVREHRLVRLPDLREAGDIPGFRPRGFPPTYIPQRNGIFYSYAASYAEETGASLIVGGHNRDDREVFDDATTPFFRSLEETLRKGSALLRKNRLRIVRPLSGRTKAEVIKLAGSMRVPLELTWSCHLDGPEHCWNCPGCLSRRSAFRAAGIRDPLDQAGMTKIT